MELWTRHYVGAVGPAPVRSREYLEVSRDTVEDSELRSLSEGEKQLVKGVLGTQSNMTFVEAEQEEKTASVPQALSICIQRGAEDLAIRLLGQLVDPFPLHLVHRAGERGLFRLLRALYDTNTPVSSARVVTRMRLLSRRYQRSDSNHWRAAIPAESSFITTGELLHWACLSDNELNIKYSLYRSVLQMDLKPDTAVSSLLSAGCAAILLEQVKKQRLRASPEAILCALEWGRLDAATALQEVRSS